MGMLKEMGMQEGDGHAGRRWACRKEMDIQEIDGHAGISWAYIYRK